MIVPIKKIPALTVMAAATVVILPYSSGGDLSSLPVMLYWHCG